MLKYFFIILLSFNILSANDNDNNIVKTSELELFLFKIGFESLLKDVDINKDKSTLNQEEIKTINEKIELIMAELYKDNRVLLKDSNENQNVVDNKFDKQEFEYLKQEISLLKEEIQKIKETNLRNLAPKTKSVNISKLFNEKKELNSKIMYVATDSANIYSASYSNADILTSLKRGDKISIEKCDIFDWCKILGEKKYIKRFLLKK